MHTTLNHIPLVRTSVSVITAITCCLQGLAYASWYDQKLEGWYYFEDPSAPSQAEDKPLDPAHADALIALESQKLKQLLSLALVSPSPEHVEQYIRAQYRWIQQSNTFSQTWGKVLLEQPELSTLLTIPTSTYGILAKKAQDAKERSALLNTLSKDHFLLFFFKGQDPLAAKACEVAQLFATTNHWKFKAVSLDKAGIPSLHEFEIDKGISDSLEVTASPSFYAIDPTHNQAYPVGVGLISVSELESNIVNQLGESYK